MTGEPLKPALMLTPLGDCQYRSLTRWWKDANGDLRGSIELPLAVGIVGGATRVHPVAGLALRILGIQSAGQLSEIAAACGTCPKSSCDPRACHRRDQQGHMRMHARQLALAAGAQGDLVTRVVQTMISEGQIRLERAKTLVQEWTVK